MATINETLPPFSSAAPLSLTLEGVEQYKYAVGVAADVDCSNSAIYGAAIPADTPLALDMTPLPDGELKLCIIGQSSDGRWQSVAHATQKTWIKDSVAPVGPAGPTDHGLYDDETLTYAWTAVADVGPAGLTGYELEVRTVPDNTIVFGQLVGMALAYDVPGEADKAYVARVRAIDGAGNASPWSADSDGVTVDAAAPVVVAAPADDGVYTNTTTVNFLWNVTTDVGLAGLAAYEIEVGSTPGANDIFNGPVGLNTTYAFVGSEGATYFARVRALDAAGNVSAWSADSDGVMVDTTSPTGASSLKIAADNPVDAGAAYDDDTTVHFAWTAGSDTASGLTPYKLTHYPNGTCAGGGTDILNVAATNYSFAGANGQTYSFKVTTSDQAGYSVVSGCSPPMTIITDTPVVSSVSAPSQSRVSLAGTILSSDVNVVCSMTGEARIDDNADDDEIAAWQPVVAGVPKLFSITGTDLASVSAADGAVTLKVICRSLSLVPSSPDTSRSIVLDTTPPPAMQAFSGVTGTVADGDIILTLDYPADVSDFGTVQMRRLPGATPPDADCTSDGTQVYSSSGPFVDGPVTNATGAAEGQHFSYTLCIRDTVGHLVAVDTADDIGARDVTAPPALTSFSATTGAVTQGDIDLTWTYPAGIADYMQLEIRELAGGTAPNADCSANGTIIATITTPFSQTSMTRATGSLTGGRFSYRACITDANTNLRSSNVASNIQARDTSSPQALASFSGAAGTAHGDIDLSITNAADTSDWDVFQIRRSAGASAPANCAAGTAVFTDNTPPFTDSQAWVYTDATGATYGEAYSYRVCIWDSSSNLTTSNTAANIGARDLSGPPVLTAFSATPSRAAIGRIDVTVDFPASVLDYNQVVIRRVTGATPPADCTAGVAAKTYSTGQFIDEAFADNLVASTAYSYRACIYDLASNVTSSQTIANVLASPDIHLAFVTSSWFQGNFGGLAGADAQCQAYATAGGANVIAGTYKAILSDGSTSAATRIVVTKPVYNNRSVALGGRQLMANNEADLFDGTIGAANRYTQAGADAYVSSYASRVWTNTTAAGGIRSAGSNGDNCFNWTSNAGGNWGYKTGHMATTNGEWLAHSFEDDAFCDYGFFLYCILQ